MNLSGKKVILSVTGSIAAYKAVLLLRLLLKEGADVQVLMTSAAKEFVGPVTFSALSGKPVISEFFNDNGGEWNSHVQLGVDADLMLIAPATAATMGKMANGIADNLVLTTYLSARCPIIIVPAMDMDMYKHPSTLRSKEILQSYGNIFIEPAEGELASGLSGKGRMQEPEYIIEFIKEHPFSEKKKLLTKKVLITSGPTYEPIDPVRYIGNHSSGKMGFALAEAFANAGASVILVSGPTSLTSINPAIDTRSVVTAAEMFKVCADAFEDVDIAVFAAAVADFTPETYRDKKIKREKDDLVMRLKPTNDIAAELGKRKKENQFLVGFALETNDGIENAKRKIQKKNLDLIVLNSLEDEGAGFSIDTNKVSMFDKEGNFKNFDLKSKKEVAEDIVREILYKIDYE